MSLFKYLGHQLFDSRNQWVKNEDQQENFKKYLCSDFQALDSRNQSLLWVCLRCMFQTQPNEVIITSPQYLTWVKNWVFFFSISFHTEILCDQLATAFSMVNKFTWPFSSQVLSFLPSVLFCHISVSLQSKHPNACQSSGSHLYDLSELPFLCNWPLQCTFLSVWSVSQCCQDGEVPVRGHITIFGFYMPSNVVSTIGT